MAFFPSPEVESRTTPTADDYAHADRLRAILLKNPSRVRRWRRSAWASEFRILRQEILTAGGHPKFAEQFPDLAAKAVAERIGKVLTFYAKASGIRADLPLIQSAATFRKCFDWLERLAAKSADSDILHLLSEADDDAAADLYQRLQKYRWGRGESALYTAVKRSVVRHAAVVEKVRPHLGTGTAAGRFASWLWGRLATPNFLLTWFVELWRSVKGWDEWSGSFTPFEFRPTSKTFVKRMTALSVEYGDPNAWVCLCHAAGISIPEETST